MDAVPLHDLGPAQALCTDGMEDLAGWGNWQLLRAPALAVLGSRRFSTATALQTRSLGARLDLSDTALVGGFDSPLEKEFLAAALGRAKGFIVLFACAPVHARPGLLFRKLLREDRMLLLCRHRGPRRPDVRATANRNRAAAKRSGAVLVTHASPGGRTLALCTAALGWGKRVYAIDTPDNVHLFALGVTPLNPLSTHLPR